MSKKNNPYGKGLREYRLTKKGLAVYLAIKHGYCPEVDGKYDTEKFERFWNEFESELRIQEIEPEKEQINYKTIFLVSVLTSSIIALLDSLAKLFLA